MQDELKGSVHKTKLLVIFIVTVCAVALVVHWPSLSAEALSIDDDQYFIENVLVQKPGLKSAWRFLSEVLEPSTVGGYYQPLTMISLMADHALGGRVDNLTPFHCTSLTLHMVNTALVIVLLYLLFGNVWAAAGIGLLFGVHPMTVEPVTWVSERKTLLAAFFVLWSLTLYVCYARKEKRRFYFGCLAMYILALMSKPTSTPLPMVMLLMDYWPLRRFNRRAVLEKIPFFVIGAISAVITYISQSRTAIVGLPMDYGPERIPLVLCHNIIFYLYKIVWPVKLSSYYPYPVEFSLSDPMLMAGIIGSCILILLLIISLRWTRAVLAGWLIFFVAMLPTMQIIGFSNVIAADKFAYLPSIGLMMILAAFVTWFCSTNKTLIWRVAILVVVLVAAGAEAVGTRRYLVNWRNMMTLSKHFLTLAPDAAQINLMMGYALQREGRLDEAEYYCRRAVQLAPDYSDASNNLALVLKLQGRFEEAADYYRKALEGPLKDANIQYNLANTLQSMGRSDEAIKYYYEALKMNPEHVYAHNNLANVLAEQGKLDAAVTRYRQALKIKPSYPEAYNNLGTTLELQGKLDEAIDCYSQAIRINPDFREAHYNLICLLASRDKLDGAISYYRQVLKINLEDAEAHNSFGVGLLLRGKINEATRQFKLALQSDPVFFEAYRNLALLSESRGKIEQAVAYHRKFLELQPDDIEVHIKVANLLASQNKFDEAADYFNQALRLAPNDAKIHYSMGMALAMAEKPEKAIEHFRQALQLKPFWYEPAIWIARILAVYPDAEVRDPDKAVIIAVHAARLTKYQNPEVLEILAVSYAAAGQLNLAVETAQKALELAVAARDNRLVGRLRNAIERYRQKNLKTESKLKIETDSK